MTICMETSLTLGGRFFSAKPALKNRSTVFTVGNRGSVLNQDLEASIIVPHAAQKGEQKVQ